MVGGGWRTVDGEMWMMKGGWWMVGHKQRKDHILSKEAESAKRKLIL
jgi:hypothetical protein